ncbi:MAG: ABC transporter permease, partial [Pseudomonadota bacterium]|nr:ABC transporter permease [Pseudomonadota bacterium]
MTRAIQALMVAVLIGAATFAMMRALPGDAAYRIAAGRYGYDNVDTAAADAVRDELGLGGPALPAFLGWLGDLLRLDFGTSLVTGQPVIEEIGHQLGASMALAGVAVLLSLILGPPLGILAGLRPSGVLDRVLLVVSTGLKAVPQFLMALILILILSVQFRLLPAAGHGEARHFILPALALALGLAAVNARIARDAMARIGSMPFYSFAQWKGLSPRQTLWRHGLRNVSVPLLTYLGLQFVTLVEGVVVVEA